MPMHKSVSMRGRLTTQKRAVIENRDQTARPVGLKLPNRWGLFDMYGNALEMCDESVAPDELASISDRLALENVFERHVSPLMRGSSYDFPSEYARSHVRTKTLSGVLSKAADFVWFGHSYVSSVPINQENRDGA